MTADFDPYRKWLGIPPHDQPPNHYRLLGIELFESDADVIANAADQRAIHLKTFATGPYAHWAEQLLNEVATARVCLLNPDEKAKYDARLRARMETEVVHSALGGATAASGSPSVSGSNIGRVSDTLAVTPKIAAAFATSEPSLAHTADGAEGSVNHPPQPEWSWLADFDWRGNLPVLIAAGAAFVICTVVLTVAIVSLAGRTDRSIVVADAELAAELTFDDPSPNEPTDPVSGANSAGINPSNSQGGAPSGESMTPSSGSDVPKNPMDTQRNAPTANPSQPSNGPDSASADSPNGSGQSGGAGPSGSSATVPSPPSGPSKEPASEQGAKPSAGGVRSNEPTEKPQETSGASSAEPPEGVAAKLPPAPPNEYVQETERELRTLFKEEILKPGPEARLQLIRKLESLAAESKNDLNQQYAIWHTAVALAVEGELIDQAMSLLDKMQASFDFNVYEKKAAILAKLNAPGSKMTPVLNAKLLSLAQAVLDEARQSGEAAAALVCADVASKTALRAKDAKLRSYLDKLIPELEELKKQQELAQKAFERLKSEPDNPKANTVAGLWNCLMRRQWEVGLKQLTKGHDPALATLAARDLAGAQQGREQADLGDAWWDCARQYKGLEQHRMKERAVHWYAQAMNQLSGLELARLKVQLDEKGLMYKPFALEFNGVDSVVVIEPFRYDGSYPITLELICQPAIIRGREGRAIQNLFGNACDIRTGLMLNLVSHTFRFEVGTATSGWAVCAAPGPITYDLRAGQRPRGPRGAGEVVAGSPAAAGSADPHNPPELSDLPWYHLAGVYTGSQIQLYVNGRRVGRENVSGAHKVGIAPMLIGAGHHQPNASSMATVPTNFFTGAVRGARISAGARYQQDFPPPKELSADSATVLLFTFTEGKGMKLFDASGNKNVGTIINGRWVPLGTELRLPPLPR